MKGFVFLAAASLALVACGGGASDADGGGDAAEAVLLANGMPAYTGFVEADATGETTDADSKKHEIVYTSGRNWETAFRFIPVLMPRVMTSGRVRTGHGW